MWIASVALEAAASKATNIVRHTKLVAAMIQGRIIHTRSILKLRSQQEEHLMKLVKCSRTPMSPVILWHIAEPVH